MIYQQNSLRLECVFPGGPVYQPKDQATGAPAKVWQGQELRVDLGFFQSDGAATTLTNILRVDVALFRGSNSDIPFALQSTTNVTQSILPSGWKAGTVQNATVAFTPSDMDQGLDGTTARTFYMSILGYNAQGQAVYLSGGDFEIVRANTLVPMPPFDGVSYRASLSSTGNLTLAPGAEVHTEAVTVSGAPGTRIVILPTAGITAGALIQAYFTFPATAGIAFEFRTGAVGGPLALSVTTDGSSLSGAFCFVFTGTTWIIFSALVPAIDLPS
jgi:hypothetical protein